jgi:deoxyribodipyrimidine photo-lyase
MCCFEDGLVTAVADEEKEQMQQRLEQWKATSGFGSGENPGTEGVRFELLWRDYMRLVAKKYGTRMFLLNGLRGSSPPTDYQNPPAAGESEGQDAQASKPPPPPKKWQLIDDQTTRQKLSRFRTGTTGTGLIDASLRELLRTGYTSNRARQNVASFLSKHLNIDWRLGAEWYECMLVDYDCASNWGNWQYVAGVGNDPRQGRMFNPVKQGLDYDSRGEYVKAWVPELRGVEVSVDAEGKPDEEALMGVFQAWRLPEQEKQRLGLKGLEWVERPLVKIPFSVGRKPRVGPPRGGPPRGRGGYRGRGRGRGWRGRGSGEAGVQEQA